MVLFLITHVRYDICHRSVTKSQRAITFLPIEMSRSISLLIDVTGASAFKVLDTISDCNPGRNRNGNVNVVFDISNCVHLDAKLFSF